MASVGERKKAFKPMLPSQFQSRGAQKTSDGASQGNGGLRTENKTTFRFFSNQQGGERAETTGRSSLASCLGETSDMLQKMRANSLTRAKAGPTRAREVGRAKQAKPPPVKFFSHNNEKSVDSYFSSKLSKSIESLTQSTDMMKLSRSKNAPAKTNGLLFKCKCRRFKVGKAESRYPSDVRFFDDRIEYCFVRESQFGKDHIAMVMFYRDMVSAKLSEQQGSFVYRIPRELHHYFQDYEPENQTHVMKVKFDRQSEVAEFKENVLPVIRGSML